MNGLNAGMQFLIVGEAVEHAVGFPFGDVWIIDAQTFDERLLGKDPWQEPLGFRSPPFLAQLMPVGSEQRL